jgi:hypothetical protein
MKLRHISLLLLGGALGLAVLFCDRRLEAQWGEPAQQWEYKVDDTTLSHRRHDGWQCLEFIGDGAALFRRPR